MFIRVKAFNKTTMVHRFSLFPKLVKRGNPVAVYLFIYFFFKMIRDLYQPNRRTFLRISWKIGDIPVI